jgi:hypothetical protein
MTQVVAQCVLLHAVVYGILVSNIALGLDPISTLTNFVVGAGALVSVKNWRTGCSSTR